MPSPLSRPPLLREDLDGIVARLTPLASRLKHAKVLVAGATGFVGSWMLESILALDRECELGLKVSVLAQSPGAFAIRAPHLVSDSRVDVHEGDLEGIASMDGVGGITHVVHAASNVNRRMTPSEALEALRTLDQGTESLLQAARAWPLQRMLYLSSAAVYDRIQPSVDSLSDASNCPPVLGTQGAYAVGKRMAELRTVLHASASSYEAVVARLGAFLGPLLPLDGGFAAGNFVRDALAGRPIQLLGDGTPLRSYQYAADMAVWLWALLLSGESGEAYNVGGDVPISLRNLAEVIDRVAGGAGVKVFGVPDPGRPVDAYIPPVHKAMQGLGLSNQVGIEEAIRRTLRWYSLQSPRTRE